MTQELQSKHSKALSLKRYLHTSISIAVFLTSAVLTSCGGSSSKNCAVAVITAEDVASSTEEDNAETYNDGYSDEAITEAEIISETDETPDVNTQSEAQSPDSEAAKVTGLKTKSIGSYAEVFNDSNKYQYAAAERIGIKPIYNIRDAYYTRRPLVKVTSCDVYAVDELTHSMPYLVPEAHKLLADIGRNFRDSLRNRGLDGYKPKVTSLLRTGHTVKRLRRVNVNSTDSSTHMLGTTFDISWSKFCPVNPKREISDADLKAILAEVLLDLKHQGRCMVKYERKTACFHISTIK